MKFNLFPWLAIFATLVVSFWIRIDLIEQLELSFFCDGGGQTFLCKIRWLAVQAFHTAGLGYFALFFGVLAMFTRSAMVGFWAGIVGMAGLILYSWDFSAVGFLLGVLALARAQLDDYRAEHGAGQQQA
jgi:hypothetical protein